MNIYWVARAYLSRNSNTVIMAPESILGALSRVLLTSRFMVKSKLKEIS